MPDPRSWTAGAGCWLLRTVRLTLASSFAMCAWGQDATTFHRTTNTDNWDDGGERSRYVYLHASEFFPTAVVERSGPVSELLYEEDARVGAYEFTSESGERTSLEEYVSASGIDGFIALHRGRIVYEAYPRMRPQEKHLLFSVTKAMIGTAVGLLEDRGEIDLDQSIDRYIRELTGTAWAGISVRDIMEMASGIEGAETDGSGALEDPRHKHYQLEASLGWLPIVPGLPGPVSEGDTYAFLATLTRADEPGTQWKYTSINTAVLGWLLESVTDKPLARVLSEELWWRIGAESDALLVVNELGIPVAHGGMATTLRDLARFGLLFTRSWSAVTSNQVVSPRFVERIQHDGRPELITDRLDEIHHAAYQWDGVTDRGAFFKGGFAGQFLMVFPAEDVVFAYFGTNDTLHSEPEGLPLRRMVDDLFGEP